MAESHVSEINWSGEADIGKSLLELVPEDVDSSLEIEGDSAHLSVIVSADSLASLREKVDSILALFTEIDQ